MTVASTGGIGRTCEACATENAWNRRFCRACGAKVVARCAGCDFGNAISDSFCGGCGSDLTLDVEELAPQEAAKSVTRPLSPPTPPRPLDPAARALARKLSDLNSDNVRTRAVTPPPVPKNTGDATADDIGQDQIDALFG